MTFDPDWISIPGDTIFDLLEERDMSPNELANSSGLKEEYINRLILGEDSIDEIAASKLADYLGGTKGFWLRREANSRK